MMNKINKLNDWLADNMSILLSSMWCFWFIGVVIGVSAILQPPSGAYQICQFLLSTTFQALALPLINFTSQKAGQRVEDKLDTINADNKIDLESNKIELQELKNLICELESVIQNDRQESDMLIKILAQEKEQNQRLEEIIRTIKPSLTL
jgi:hypothetical protein